MKILKKFGSILFSGLLFLTACNSNDNSSTTDTKDSTSTGDRMDNTRADSSSSILNTNKDEDFVTDVMKSNAKEIAWLHAGISKGTDKELKTNARMMLTDHMKMDKELRDYASGKNYKMPDIDTADVANNNKDRGKDWDKDWAEKMVTEHKKLVDKFTDNENDVKDAGLKGMITKSLPTLKSHLEKAQKLEDKLKK